MHSQRPLVIAWELTRQCTLRCRHCRGAARHQDYSGELSGEEARRVIDGIAAFNTNTILIFTGGEPMMRPDLVPLIAHARSHGMHPVMAPCGHLLTPATAAELKAAGIQCLSISFDGATAETHDDFRGVAGAFARSLQGLEYAREAGIPIQINTTVSQLNADQLPAILDFAIAQKASTLDLFFLVPTGRGRELADLVLAPADAERMLHWAYEAGQSAPIQVKTTCAPHFVRVAGIRSQNDPTARPVGHRQGGCLAGRGFVFISHRGILQPCGFLDVASGDLRAVDFDFAKAYRESTVFAALRDTTTYHGKCGACDYVSTCGGCRARAYAATGDYLAAEPACPYQPNPEEARL